MAGPKFKIMIVDDNVDNRELLEDIVEDQYDFYSVESGQACLDVVSEQSPDIILLDVHMPGMDGYEVCRALKENPNTGLIPIVFVSALASPEERLTGYEAGAEEYITKPFLDEQILETVEKILDQRSKTLELETRSRDAMTTAFQAMTNSAELGQIIQFLQASFNCHTHKGVADGLLDSTLVFGLNCCVNIRGRYANEYFGCEKGSIEARVFDRFKEGDRILDFGARTLVNSEKISLLAKNMPLDHPDNYGRIKDHLVVLVDGAEARIRAIEIENELDEERQGGLQSIIVGSHDELKEIQSLIEQQEIETQKVVSRLTDRIENILFGLGLDEEQERMIMESLAEGVSEVSGLTDYSMRVHESFNRFVGELGGLIE